MKHSTKQRILSLLVSIAMVLTFVPTLMITTVADPDASNPNFWNFRAELDDPACDDPCEIPDPACELTGGTPDSCPGDDTCVNYDAGTSFCGDPDDCDGGPCPGDDTCPDFTVGTGACNDGCVAGTPGTWTCGNADDCTQADPCMIEDPDCGEPCTITGLGDNVELVVINTDNANNRYLTLEGLEIPDNFADADTIQLVFALDGSQASTNRGVTVWTDLMDGATIGLAADADQGDAIYAQSTGGTSIVVELPVTALVDGADEATEINVAFSYNNNASGFDANGRVGVSPVRPLHVAFMNSAISATLTFAFEFTCDSDICCVVCCDYDGIECTVTACECCLVCEETICECCAICLIPCAGDNTSLCYEVCEFDRVGGTVANPHPTAERGGGSIIHGFTNANVVNVDEDHPHRGGVRFNINELVAGTNVCVSDVAGFTFGATADNSATDTLQIVPLIQTRDADDEIVTVNPGVTYCTSGSLNVGRIWMGRPAGFGAGTASAFGTFFNGTTLDETPGFTEPGSNANHPDDPATFVNGADDYLTITFRANQPRYNRHKVTSLTLLDSEGEELGTVVWRSSDNYGGWSAFFSSVDCEVCDDCDFGCLANDVDQHFRSICGDGTCNSPCCSDCSECPSCGDGGDLETREVTVIYPTCSQYGVANVECAFCFTVTTDDDGDDVTVVIPALGPNVPEYPGAEWTTVAPTCLEDGYRWALCLGYNDNGDCDCCVGDATNGGNGTTNGGNGTTNGGNGTTNGGNGTTNGGNGGTDAGIAPTNSLITDTDDLVELGYYWTVDTFTQVEGEGRRDLQSYFDGIVPVAHEIVIADGRSSVTAVRVTWEVPATVTDPVVGVNFVTNDNVNGWAQTTMTYDAIVDDAEFVFEVEVDEYPVMEFFQIMLYSGTAVMPTGVTALVELLGDDDDANGSNGGTDNGGNGTDNGGNGTTNGGNGTDNGGNGTTNGGNGTDNGGNGTTNGGNGTDNGGNGTTNGGNGGTGTIKDGACCEDECNVIVVEIPATGHTPRQGENYLLPLVTPANCGTSFVRNRPCVDCDYPNALPGQLARVWFCQPNDDGDACLNEDCDGTSVCQHIFPNVTTRNTAANCGAATRTVTCTVEGCDVTYEATVPEHLRACGEPECPLCNVKCEHFDPDTVEWVIESEPTCVGTGSKIWICDVDDCPGQQTRTIPALGHSFERDDAADYECGDECADCDVVFECGEEDCEDCNPPTGDCGDNHTWGTWGAWSSWNVTSAATCTATGSRTRTRTRTCTVEGCNATDTQTSTETIPARGHSWPTVTTRNTAANCGATTRQMTCTRSGCTARNARPVPANLRACNTANCTRCNAGCDCNNCEDCGFLGGAFGLGRVTGGDEITIADALAILRYLVNLPGAISGDVEGVDAADARAAASITAPDGTAESPVTIADALAVLRYLVDLDNAITTANEEAAA